LVKVRNIKIFSILLQKVIQHNTSHDNWGDNRFQDDGGSIAKINADGTFTHVEEVDLNDGDDY